MEKSNKYAHFISNIKLETTVIAFEVSSRGYISPDNHQYLHKLHTFCKPGVKLNTFKKNISALNIYSSYHIWLVRNDPEFVEPPFLHAPFSD